MKKHVILERTEKTVIVISNRNKIDLNKRKQYLSDNEIRLVEKYGIKVLPFIESKKSKKEPLKKKKVSTKKKTKSKIKENVKKEATIKKYNDGVTAVVYGDHEKPDEDLIGKTPGGYVDKLN